MPTVITGKLPQARVSDKAICVGPTDVIVKGSSTVLVGGLPAARIGDNTAHGGVIVSGCFTVLIGDAGGGGSGGGGGAGAGLSAASAFSDPAAQAQALINAAKSGAPFCARCAAESPMQWTKRQAAAAADAAAAAARAAAAAARDAATAAGKMVDKILPDSPKKYGKAIVIEGDEKFQKQVTADLDKIKKTPTGAKLLGDIDKSGKTIKIAKTDKGNSVTGFTGGAMKKKGGTNGAGSDSTVNYNPDRTKIGTEKWSTRPPAIGLAHELVHAQHAAEGSIDVTSVANDSKPDPANPGKMAQEKLEEVRTTGIPPHDKGRYSENAIRSEWDPKQPSRGWY